MAISRQSLRTLLKTLHGVNLLRLMVGSADLGQSATAPAGLHDRLLQPTTPKRIRILNARPELGSNARLERENPISPVG